MSRTARYKIGYVMALTVLGFAAVGAIRLMGGGVPVLLAIGMLLFVPGRVQGFFYRPLFQGRRLLDGGQSAEAVAYFESFLRTLRAEPWRKQLLWLSWSIYTPDAEAMALNNIGAAKLVLGDIGESEQSFQNALSLDPLYSLPYFNLAVIHEMRGNRSLAEQAATQAKLLGYTGSTIDRVVHRAQSLLARVEGRGVTRS